MRPYRAQLGNRSLTVDVAADGTVTLPPDTTLEDGRWLLSKDGTTIGVFEVQNGNVGTAWNTIRTESIYIAVESRPASPRLRRGFVGTVTDLIHHIWGPRSRQRREEARRPQQKEPSTADMLEADLHFAEMVIRMLGGSTEPCPGCGGVHTLNDAMRFGATLGLTPDMPLQALENFRRWVRENNLPAMLERVVSGGGGRHLSLLGYTDKAEVQAHLNRLRVVLAWQPKSPADAPAAAAPDAPTSDAPAATEGGEEAAPQ